MSGKAKRLRNRVRSYFATDFADSPRNRLLQRLIADVETFVVPNEPGSLILENNLIKEVPPSIPGQNKDDKSYTLHSGDPRLSLFRGCWSRSSDIPGPRYFVPTSMWHSFCARWPSIRRLYTV